ncbi:TIGR03086 family metal-binding protein [Streptomyces sp. NPDC020917]|uniref:TIGR03086 family metal-binding protein n=1 Tax=Streptomyces sp. NPDC020917 TaxID=3365102 RepID=UPI00378E1963
MHTNIGRLLTLDAEAVRASQNVVARVTAADLDRPTPCAAWTLRDLLAHMTAQHRGFAAAAKGGGSLEAWRPQAEEPDPAGAYMAAADDVLTAFAEPGVLERSFLLPELHPERTFPGALAVGFHLLDYVVHAWDVAQSLDIPVEFGPQLLDAALAVARAVPDGPARNAPGSAFAPRIPYPGTDSHGTPLDAILCLLGRSPTWPEPTSPTIWPLHTDRLRIDLFTADDVDAMHAYQGLPEVARYLYRPPRTRERTAEVVDAISQGSPWANAGDSLVLAVRRIESPEPIGEIVLKLADARARQVEIGWVFHPQHGGKGYATEAAGAVAAAAFGTLGAHRLFARLDTRNAASIRVCERLGMRREAHLVENDLDGTDWSSEYVYAALARELA